MEKEIHLGQFKFPALFEKPELHLENPELHLENPELHLENPDLHLENPELYLENPKLCLKNWNCNLIFISLKNEIARH